MGLDLGRTEGDVQHERFSSVKNALTSLHWLEAVLSGIRCTPHKSFLWRFICQKLHHFKNKKEKTEFLQKRALTAKPDGQGTWKTRIKESGVEHFLCTDRSLCNTGSHMISLFSLFVVDPPIWIKRTKPCFVSCSQVGCDPTVTVVIFFQRFQYTF